MMGELMDSFQQSSVLPPPLDLAASAPRRGSEASPSRSSFQSSNASRIHTPSTSIPSTPILPARPLSPDKRTLYPGESDNLLTAVAAQERRVLELKEELQKAEIDLARLKKQWASHEAKRKRNEARNSEQLQPLKTSFPEYNAIREESPVLASREMDRRQTLSSSVKSSQRKVFSGSRHTRTLSLLATNNSKAELQYPPREDSLKARQRVSPDSTEAISELAVHKTPSKPRIDSSKTSEREMIIQTGKQLVGDFRQGFWTFVEDLKQVTVGDESSPVGETGVSPKGFLHGPKKVVETSTEDSKQVKAATKDHKEKEAFPGRIRDPTVSDQAQKGIAEGIQHTPSKDSTCTQPVPKISKESDNEGWDNWDVDGSSDLG